MMWAYHLCVYVLSRTISEAHSRGLLLLNRPRDISNDCAFSHRLRYDISFGMGMSDSITLVFRTLSEIDYECAVEIVTESDQVHILVVIRFPGNIATNCAVNQDAFTVIKKNRCFRLCDVIGARDALSPFFVVSVRGRIRFRFLSNSSINSEINANLYQVTATSARVKPRTGCSRGNETICIIEEIEYCFTSGVVCDGIKNCGVADWFDERKAECGLPVERLGYAPVIAVVAAILCALLAAGHILLRCLPPLANSFFIFNTNEDNRLCIDTVFKSSDVASTDIEQTKRMSLIPVLSSSSSSNGSEIEEKEGAIIQKLQKMSIVRNSIKLSEEEAPALLKTTIKSMTEKIQKKIMSVTGRGKDEPKSRDVLPEASVRF